MNDKNQIMKLRINKLLFFLCIVFSFTKIVYSQEEVSTKKVIIGIKLAPPFVERSNMGSFRGLSIDSWDLVNNALGWDYEYKLYDSLPALMDAVKSKEVDFSINPITVTEERFKEYNFTQPYFISNTVMARKSESAIWNVLVNLWSWQFISAVGVLVSIIFIFGFLIWFFERKKNKEQFGGKWKGIGQGFWWSAVTMTTVGYGDKAPQTTMGRFVGIIWMFFAVITISSLTAGIASSLTVQNLNDEITSVNDLVKFKVETVGNSSSESYLESYHINYKSVPSVKEGLEHLKNGTSQIFVYDEPLVYYEIDKLGLKKDIQIMPYILRKDYFSYCFSKDSKLEEQINPILISSLKTLDWMSIIKKYQYQK